MSTTAAPRPTPTRLPRVKAGFLPLTDSAILIVAHEKGFDAAQGLQLALTREKTWTSVRDRMNEGAFDCAHMSAGTPLAMRLGLGSSKTREPVFVPFTMGRGGTSIVLSNEIMAELKKADPENVKRGGMAVAEALRTLLTSPEHALRGVISARTRVGETPLSLSVPYPYASHNYDLRYWLAHAGLDPNRDVSIVVMARGHMLQALQSGRIQGFIMAEPWSSLAVHEGLGHIVATKSELWPGGPEKVLGVRQRWAEDNPDLVDPLIRAMDASARWLDIPENREEASRILSDAQYLGLPEDVIFATLSGRIVRSPGTPPTQDDDFFVFHRDAANFPWCSHAMWMLTQMIRWGDIRDPIDLKEIAGDAWRPDIYREALADVPEAKLNGSVPLENMKPELHQGGFFGTRSFDPTDPLGYLDSFDLHARKLPLEALSADDDPDAFA